MLSAVMNNSYNNQHDRRSGKVKWYSDRKGYGFIDLDGGEVFIHRSALIAFGALRLQAEDIITITVRETDLGLVVDQLFGIERPPIPEDLLATEPDEGEEFAEVKFFNDAKGYGFLVVENHPEDVFIHSRILEKTGLQGLNTGQQLLVRVEPGDDGGQVATIRLFVGGGAGSPQPKI